MMSRLITDEGGWGRLEFDFSRFPLRVTLHNSQEARWLGPASEPVCHFYAGIVAGYASTISGETLVAKRSPAKPLAHQLVFSRYAGVPLVAERDPQLTSGEVENGAIRRRSCGHAPRGP